MPATVASIDVTLRLLGADQFQSKMRESASASEQTGARVKRSIDGIASSSEKVGQSANNLFQTSTALRSISVSAVLTENSIAGLDKRFSALGATVAALAGGTAFNAFKNYADTATNISNRLASVLPIQAQRAAVDQQIFDTAQRTRTSYEATANLFSRLTLSSSQLGASQTDILKVVETTQKALQAGGATVAESASIATQLSQALGSGRLAGDELKSIAENSPVLIQAIAREFNTTVGGLKEMGSNGELAAGRVFKAILNAGTEVDDVFSRITPTIAGGVQQIDNALTRYIGNLDKGVGVTKALSGGLEFVAKNIAGIGDAAILAVAALAGPIGSRLLGGASSRVARPFRDASAAAKERLDSATGALSTATSTRETAQARLREAERVRASVDGQSKFRQAAPEVQRAYEQQAAKVDRLREISARATERESAALLKRSDAEGVFASISQAAAARVEGAKGKLAWREAMLNDLLAKRPALEQAAAQAGGNGRAPAQLAALDTQIEKRKASLASQAMKLATAEAQADESMIASAHKRARVQAGLDAAAIASTAQRRAASQALTEAEARLGSLAGQVGASAVVNRTQAVEEVSRAQGVLNRAYFAEQEALGSVATASARTSTAKVALAGAARTATGAFSGLVGMLGGPLGAALTAASVATIGYELYQARAAARTEEHTAALGRLGERLQQLKAQNLSGEVRSDRDLVADRATIESAAKAARERRDILLDAYNRASSKDSAQTDLGGGIFSPSLLGRAAVNVGVNLASVIAQLRELPSSSEAATQAGEALNRVLTEAAKIDPRYGPIAQQAAAAGDEYSAAALKVREFQVAREDADRVAKSKTDTLDVSLEDFAGGDIDAVAQQGRDAADAFSTGFNTQVQTGGQITDALLAEGEKAKEAFQGAIGEIDTDALSGALKAVGSSLQTVKADLDGTKVASGEAAAASLAMAKALELLGQARPDLGSVIVQAQQLANAYRQAIGLQQIAANTVLSGDDKVAAETKLREQSLKKLEDRLQAADKSPVARRVRLTRDLPGLSQAEIAHLDTAENPEKAGRRPARSKDQRNADTLSRKLEELSQDAQVAALNDFDQKTVRFAQSAKVAADQINTFIASAKSGDLTSIPPAMQDIYDKMRQLEGVKLGKAALDDLFPGRLLEQQIESVRRAAKDAPEIAANLDLIESRLREKAAPEWASGFSTAFSDMAKSVVAGTATAADALTAFKSKIVNLALDAAFKPVERMLSGLLGSTFAPGACAGSGGAIEVVL
ncbi:tape measure protein [Methylobacterium sp. SD274]|uniref:tape measure protein n=1 Tax=Methylobacterium sp. SD274 TaxID=2782009 RepID=UPI001A966674|nr:tape measure protein [Methylobacterium sp. SD274]MBO1021650.1 tape measure protein [Methylobacterium sp. SD274]